MMTGTNLTWVTKYSVKPNMVYHIRYAWLVKKAQTDVHSRVLLAKITHLAKQYNAAVFELDYEYDKELNLDNLGSDLPWDA
jgi:hypothetical protein